MKLLEYLKMKLKKPKFWDYDKPNLLSNILFPFSKIFELISKIKNKKSEKFSDIKSICVGNIYLGGTGKTTLSIELKKILDHENIKSCFIKKNHKNQFDEIRLLKKFGKIFIEKDRIKALNNAISEKYQVAIFDDGLQDKGILYDLSFVCFNQKNMVGNSRLIPAGPLRENLDSLKTNTNIFIIGNNTNNTVFKNLLSKNSSNLEFFDCTYEPLNLTNFNRGTNYIAFSGIGNHETFVEMLKENKFIISKHLEYPDHYSYSLSDIHEINQIAKSYDATIITTKKDFLRIEDKYQKNIEYIDVGLKIRQIEKLKQKLKFIYENN